MFWCPNYWYLLGVGIARDLIWFFILAHKNFSLYLQQELRIYVIKYVYLVSLNWYRCNGCSVIILAAVLYVPYGHKTYCWGLKSESKILLKEKSHSEISLAGFQDKINETCDLAKELYSDMKDYACTGLIGDVFKH